ncbi:atherin-like [Lontra canadensis]|uniref:atherin-like n=1 Tax=Lontra canadensis TaxID=76717 RepID=UPI0013F35C9D|nr:atherin-like [Lontra canadensis]
MRQKDQYKLAGQHKREKLRRREQPDSQTGPGRKHESRETIRLCLGVRGTAASSGLRRQTPTQTGGTGLGRGCESVPACACALFPPPQLPLPPITAPLRTRLVEGGERSLAGPAQRDENTAGPPAGPVTGFPRAWWIGGWEEEGKRGPTRPAVSSSAARRSPSRRLRRLGLPSRPAPALPAPYSRENRFFRPPPRLPPRLIGLRRSRAAPLAQQQAARAYFLSSKLHLGFYPATGVCACAESALLKIQYSMPWRIENRDKLQ